MENKDGLWFMRGNGKKLRRWTKNIEQKEERETNKMKNRNTWKKILEE